MTEREETTTVVSLLDLMITVNSPIAMICRGTWRPAYYANRRAASVIETHSPRAHRHGRMSDSGSVGSYALIGAADWGRTAYRSVMSGRLRGGALALIENEIEYERTWSPERTS